MSQEAKVLAFDGLEIESGVSGILPYARSHRYLPLRVHISTMRSKLHKQGSASKTERRKKCDVVIL